MKFWSGLFSLILSVIYFIYFGLFTTNTHMMTFCGFVAAYLIFMVQKYVKSEEFK